MERTELLQKCEDLLQKCEGEKRPFTEEEQREYDTSTAEIKRIDELAKRRADLAQLATVPAIPRQVPQEQPQLTSPNAPEQPWLKHHGGLRAYKNDLRAGYMAGCWFLSQFTGNRYATSFLQRHAPEYLAGNEGTNTQGGVLVPDEMVNRIIALRETYGVLRQEAEVYPMASDTFSIPRRTGGVTVYFPGENGSITDSTPSFDMVTGVAKKIAALVLFSSELNEDAIVNIGDYYTTEIAYAFANKEDDCGFNGTGAGATYGGIWGVLSKINDGNHTASISTAVTGNTAFSSLDLADFNALTALLPSYAVANAKWYVSPAGFAASCERLAYAAGGNTLTDLTTGRPQKMFLGYPVVLTSVLNSTLTAQTSTLVLLFGDLRMAVTLGSRRQIQIALSDQRYFEYDQLALRGTERFDVVCHELGSTTAAGPLVALSTAAS